MSDNNLDQYKLKSIDYNQARKSIKMKQNQDDSYQQSHVDNVDDDSANQSEYNDKCQIPSEPRMKKGLKNKSKGKKVPSRSLQKQQQSQQQNQEDDPQKPIKKQTKKPQKKRIKKEQQNQGVRIAKQKKIQYIFRNICNPSGTITIQSLGKALVKHKIQFKLSQLQQMIVLCEKVIEDVDREKAKEIKKRLSQSQSQSQSQGQITEDDDDDEESSSFGDSWNFQSNQINQQVRNIAIEYTGFNKFYRQKF